MAQSALFVGSASRSDSGGRHAAAIYTLVKTCKFADVLYVADDPAKRIF